jgi:hypothetical protein
VLLVRVDLDEQIVQELVAVVLAGLREHLEMLRQIVDGHSGTTFPVLIELHGELTVVAARF